MCVLVVVVRGGWWSEVASWFFVVLCILVLWLFDWSVSSWWCLLMRKVRCCFCKRRDVVAVSLHRKYCGDCRDVVHELARLEWKWFSWARRNDPGDVWEG